MTQEIIIHQNPPPMIRVSGTHRELGRQIGEAMAPQIRHSVDNARRLVELTSDQLQLNWESAINQSHKYIPFSQERFPQYVEEMVGMAEGAGITFEDVAVVNGLEAVTMDALHLTKCTSMAVNQERSANGHVLVAHNEDWLPEDEPDVYLIHATPNDEPPFLAMTYGALLPNIGFNALGLAQCCDSVYPNDSRIGTPRVVVSRAVLAARSIDDAIRRTTSPQRAAGYNHVIAHESGELYSIEVSARHSAILYSENNLLVHTNHYLDAKMQPFEEEPGEMVSTKVRYFRARRLLEQKPLHSIATLQNILRDHTNHPDSLCNHCVDEINPLDREKTICSMVMDLTARQMHFAWGNPCKNSYHIFQL